MFYLKEIFKIYGKNPISSIFSILATVILITIVGNYSTLESRISAKLPKIENDHYFNALFDSSRNVKTIKRKISDLPGVKGIKILSNTETVKKVSEIGQYVELESKDKASLAKNIVMKITFQQEVSASSINLIREYLVRLAGKDNVVLGRVKKKISNDQNYTSFLAKLKRWPLQIGIGVTALFWIISLVLFSTRVGTFAFVIENFQRKTKVTAKLLATHFSLTVVTALAISLLSIKPDVYFMVGISLVMLMIPLMFAKKRDWGRA